MVPLPQNGIDMSIPAALPVKVAGPETPKAAPAGNPLTRLSKSFVSATNVPIVTRVFAAFGNVRAGIRLAALRGDVRKLETLYSEATKKHRAAKEKLDGRKEDVVVVATTEKRLGGYDRSEALSYESQKYKNENMIQHEAARHDLLVARQKVTEQGKTVDKYRGRMALALQSLRSLGVEI